MSRFFFLVLILLLLIFETFCCDLHYDGSKVYILNNTNFEEMTKVDGLNSFWVVLFHQVSKPESFIIFEKMRQLAENPSKEMEFGIIDWYNIYF